MIRLIKRHFAIRSYMLRLSCELFQRFEKQKYYSIEQVTQAAERSHLSTVFIAYAHACFCSRKDFDAYYGPMKVACTYDGLQRKVRREYFPGFEYFDGGMIVERFARSEDWHFTNSAPAWIGYGYW